MKKIQLLIFVSILAPLGSCLWQNSALPFGSTDDANDKKAEVIQKTLENMCGLRIGQQSWTGELSLGSPPDEFAIFEGLQQLRKAGYVPEWNDYKYQLTEMATGKTIDIFIRNKSKEKKEMERFSGQLLWNLVGESVLCDGGRVDDLYRCYLYDLMAVIRDDKCYVVDKAGENDYIVTFEQIRCRNAAVGFNFGKWWNGIGSEEDESILKEYDLIMKKKDGLYLPVHLENGKELELLPNGYLTSRLLENVNEGVDEFGKDYFSNRDTFNVFTGGHCLPQFIGLSAKMLLDLYRVPIRWNDDIQQFQVQD